MGNVIRIFDETWGQPAASVGDGARPGKKVLRCELRLVSNRVSARDIVRGEVREHLEAEARARSEVDATIGEDALARAVNQVEEAFAKRQFVIFFRDRQILSLDEMFDVEPDMEFTFVRLTPLKGG